MDLRWIRFPDFPNRGDLDPDLSSILDLRATTLVQSFSSRHDASHTSVVLVSVYHYFSLQISLPPNPGLFLSVFSCHT